MSGVSILSLVSPVSPYCLWCLWCLHIVSGVSILSLVSLLSPQACDSLIAELIPIKTAADRVLHYFHEQPSSTQRLRQISEIKRHLGSSKEKACGVQRAIRELLNEEEDMLRLEVSKFWGRDELWDDPPKTADAEDAEILLECYEQEVEAINQVRQQIDKTINCLLIVLLLSPYLYTFTSSPFPSLFCLLLQR